jgi:hypothetical protein
MKQFLGALLTGVALAALVCGLKVSLDALDRAVGIMDAAHRAIESAAGAVVPVRGQQREQRP